MDVSSAFASILRRLCFDNHDGDEGWLLALKQVGFEESDIKDLFSSASAMHNHYLGAEPPPSYPLCRSHVHF